MPPLLGVVALNPAGLDTNQNSGKLDYGVQISGAANPVKQIDLILPGELLSGYSAQSDQASIAINGITLTAQYAGGLSAGQGDVITITANTLALPGYLTITASMTTLGSGWSKFAACLFKFKGFTRLGSDVSQCFDSRAVAGFFIWSR